MLKKSTGWCVLIYGVVMIFLGVYGYVTTQSKISLFSGSGFGLLLILSAFGIFKHSMWSARIALFLTLLLTGVFASRYSTTGKPLPALLSVISGGMLLFLIAQAGTWKKKKD